MISRVDDAAAAAEEHETSNKKQINDPLGQASFFLPLADHPEPDDNVGTKKVLPEKRSAENEDPTRNDPDEEDEEEDEYRNDNERQLFGDNRILLHLMVVGFHHKKGCQVDFCYPPLDRRLFQHADDDDDEDDEDSIDAEAETTESVENRNEKLKSKSKSKSANINISNNQDDDDDDDDKNNGNNNSNNNQSSNNESREFRQDGDDDDDDDDDDNLRDESSANFVRLPAIWQTLPSLAIPDGAHNYDFDTVFFHLPYPTLPSSSAGREPDRVSSAAANGTLFCVSCYRQIGTKELRHRSADMTRSSVQKAVVALLRLPLFGAIERKLSIITRAYFAQRDFRRIAILRESYRNLCLQLAITMRKHISLGDDAEDDQQDDPNDQHQEADLQHQFFAGLSVRRLFARFGVNVITLFKLLLLERKTIFIHSPIRELSGSILALCSLVPGLIDGADGMREAAIPDSIFARITGGAVQRKKISTKCDNELRDNRDMISDECSNSSIKNATFDNDCCKDTKTSTKSSAANLGGHFYGFPLHIFRRSSHVLPYFSMPYFDAIAHSTLVRACIAGTSNHIFRRWKSAIDVFVFDRQIEIIGGAGGAAGGGGDNDGDNRRLGMDDEERRQQSAATLRRALKPTVEDLNFCNFIIRTIGSTTTAAANANTNSNAQNGDGDDYIIDDMLQDLDSRQRFEEGSDEWIRCHFKNYLLHALRCSLLDENSREYRSFGAAFMHEWRHRTENYRHWYADQGAIASVSRDIDPSHPFANSYGNRFNSIRFKITGLFLNNSSNNSGNSSNNSSNRSPLDQLISGNSATTALATAAAAAASAAAEAAARAPGAAAGRQHLTNAFSNAKSWFGNIGATIQAQTAKMVANADTVTSGGSGTWQNYLVGSSSSSTTSDPVDPSKKEQYNDNTSDKSARPPSTFDRRKIVAKNCQVERAQKRKKIATKKIIPVPVDARESVRDTFVCYTKEEKEKEEEEEEDEEEAKEAEDDDEVEVEDEEEETSV